jgi:hypothetical protein
MNFDQRYETSSTNHHMNYRLGQLQGNLVFTILGHFSRNSDPIIKNSLFKPMSDRLIKMISPKHVELRTSITFGIFVAHAARQNLKRLSCVMFSLKTTIHLGARAGFDWVFPVCEMPPLRLWFFRSVFLVAQWSLSHREQ